MMAAYEQIEFLDRCLEQGEFEERPGHRHQRALNRIGQPICVSRGVVRALEVVASELDVRIINGLLENVAINLEKGSSEWFGLGHDLTNGLGKQLGVEDALDSPEHAQLPLGV